jgi:lipid-A-disaccharide synthase
MPQTFFIAVGEVSGDIHGANLMRQLKTRLPDAQFTGMGGDRMLAEGQNQLYHIRQLAILGIVEVIRHLPFLRKAFRKAEAVFARGDIAAIVLVDYPGFNLRLAKIAKKYNIPVFYYICPQVWAWGKGRLKNIRKFVTHSFVIFPFEETLFQDNHIPVTYMGHPIAEAIAGLQTDPAAVEVSDKKLLALLPGSRAHEVATLLPNMVTAANDFVATNDDWEYVVAKASHLDDNLFAMVLPSRVKMDQYYNILAAADAALVASGTAVLETTIFGVPFAIVYKVNWLTWILGNLLVKLPFIGMVNILAEKEVVPELLQKEMNPRNLIAFLNKLRDDTGFAAEMRDNLQRVKETLGGLHASTLAAEKIVQMLNSKDES